MFMRPAELCGASEQFKQKKTKWRSDSRFSKRHKSAAAAALQDSCSSSVLSELSATPHLVSV